ncbi:hypothetical protein NYO99_10445 [Pelomonas sp. UHG3]|uniref:Uncharacterized protein n=1 Tax=Roseateles hydrophilus TaxID=2975054 RepID=A0ACC6CAR8_9BURK|nr:hypothetical protein [Pelomonas sp. UHG3]MCY4745389.1 hypothetical protein [Pelomonas sp. UHG3]
MSRLCGAPAGMAFAATSAGIAVSWAKPVVGTSNLVITLRNNLGQTSTGTVKVTVTAS